MTGSVVHAPDPEKTPAVFISESASETAVMARLLAISDPDSCSDVSLAQRVADGLRPAAVAAMAQALGGNKKRIIGPIVPEATFRRAQKVGKLSKEHSERLYEIGRVVIAVAWAYRGDLDRVEAFLTRPHPLLTGETPFDMARSSSAGADAVLNLIRRAEAGVSS